MASVSKREWTYKGKEKTAWIVRYFDAKGVHCQKTFTHKKQADAFKRKTEDALGDGSHIASGDARTVARVCDEFLRHAEDRVRAGRLQRTSFDNLKGCVAHSILVHLGKRQFHELTSVDVEVWFGKLCRVPSAGPYLSKSRDRKPLSPRTARDRISVLSGIFEWAIPRQYAKSNPCLRAMKAIGRIETKPIRTFKPDEIEKLLHVANTRAKWQHRRTWLVARCFVNLAAFCGLRYGEIQGLTLDNVQLEKRWLLIRHSLTDHDDLKGPKSKAGVRDVPMPPHVAALLSDWIKNEYRNNPRKLLFRGSERTVGGDRASLIHAPSFRHGYWWPLLRRAGLYHDGDPFHFHALRHFAASWMIKNGMPITDVAKVLGHAKFDLTLQVYAHSLMTDRETSDVFDAMAAKLRTPDISQVLRKGAQVIEMPRRKNMVTVGTQA